MHYSAVAKGIILGGNMDDSRGLWRALLLIVIGPKIASRATGNDIWFVQE